MLLATGSDVRIRLSALLLVATAVGAGTARAQAPLPDPIAVPTLDLFDLIRHPRPKPPGSEPLADEKKYKKPMITVAPSVTYNPATAFGFGLGVSGAFFRGDPATTSISSLLTGLKFTTKDQLIVNAKLNAFAANDRWRLVSDTRLNWTSQDTYGLGTSSNSDQAVNMKYDYVRVFETVYKQVHPHVFGGVGLLYSGYRNIQPRAGTSAGTFESPFVSHSNELGFDLGAQTSAGASLDALLDNRDQSINPSRGSYADFKFQMYFAGFLGGTSTWQLSHWDLRRYVRLTKDARQRLAFWFFGDFVTGGAAPYFDLPTTADDTYGRSGRGYTPYRFRGEQRLYGEMEYRLTLTKNGLLGMVVFLNTETLSNQEAGEKLFDSLATGVGAGLRLMLSKRSKTNLCVDFGQGKNGSQAVYVGLQEAF